VKFEIISISPEIWFFEGLCIKLYASASAEPGHLTIAKYTQAFIRLYNITEQIIKI